MLLAMMNIQDINSETFISFGHHKSFPWWNFYPFFPYGKSLRIFNIRIKSYQSFHIFTLFLSLVIKFLSRFVNWIQVFRQRVECIFKCKYHTSAMCRVQVSNQYHNSLTVTVLPSKNLSLRIMNILLNFSPLTKKGFSSFLLKMINTSIFSS